MKTKPVMVYKIDAQEIRVPLQSDYYEYYNSVSGEDCILDDSSRSYGDKPSKALLERKIVPIIQIDNFQASKLGLNPTVHTKYIAIEDELHKILEESKESEIDAIRQECKRMQKSLQSQSNLVQGHEERINTFKKMPWVWRVWSAIWNDL